MSVASGVSGAGRFGAPPVPVPRAVLAAVALGLPSLALFWWPALTRLLEYDRERIADGQLWRLVSCHWTHWSPEHLAWDLGVFVVLAALSWRAGRARLLAALGGSAVLIPLAIWVGLPAMTRYRGLSGLDSALVFLLAAGILRRELAGGRRGLALLAGAVLTGFAAKVAFEIGTASTVFVDAAASGFLPVPLAHLVGGACGLAAALAGRRRGGRGRQPDGAQSAGVPRIASSSARRRSRSAGLAASSTSRR